MNRQIQSLLLSLTLIPFISLMPSLHAQTRIEIGVIPGQLKYNLTEFEVEAGSEVEIVFTNNGLMQHNLLIVSPASLDEVIQEVMAMGTSGLANGFKPDSEEVLFATKLLNAGESETLRFTAPQTVGDYPYVCTFTGHFNTMRGIMHVKPRGESIAQPEIIETPSRRAVDALARSGANSFPVGTLEKPFVIRTFMPDIGLDPVIFANHGQGFPANNYDPGRGRDVPGTSPTIQGIPGAVGVNFGERLSFCWDTTECRLLYAWTGNFLDMTAYWGRGTGGDRRSFGYLPSVRGEVIFKALGTFPIRVNDADGSAQPNYKGYKLVNNVPEFAYEVNSLKIFERIVPGEGDTFDVHFRIPNAEETVRLAYDDEARQKIISSAGEWQEDTLVLTPEQAREFTLTFQH